MTYRHFSAFTSGKLGTVELEVQYLEGGKRVDTEAISKNTWEHICSSENEWVMHKCKTSGCSEGYVTVDGNEYLKRAKCALPKSKVKLRVDLPEVYKCCSKSPLTGGKHQKPCEVL